MKHINKILAIAVAFALTLAILPKATQAKAIEFDPSVTVEDIVQNPRTPDQLDPMTEKGYRTEAGLVNPNFDDPTGVKPRSEYGGPWSFTHQDELGGNVEDYSSFECVSIDDAVEGMGRTGGKGQLIDTALKITINKDNQDTLSDALTYAELDGCLWGEVNVRPFYFSAWIYAEQDMWFDVGISYGTNGGIQVYWDLGRRFHVNAGEWTEIGKDENGNYLPFRAKVTDTEPYRGTGSDPTAANSNCTVAPDETKGDTYIGPWWRANYGGVWGCMRLYAYADSVYQNGVGAPAANHGLKKGDSYRVTGTNFWHYGAAPAVVNTYVDTVTLDKTEATLKVGETLNLTATATPDDATDTSIYWSSEDESIATVDQTGKVTAVKAGTVKIVAEANDGAGAKAVCTVTVTADTDSGNSETPSQGGDGGTSSSCDSCGGSVAGGSILGIFALAAFAVKRRKF